MLNQITFSRGFSGQILRIPRTLEPLCQKCELATKVSRQSAIPVPRSKNGRMIQTIFGAKMHAAARRRRVDTPAQSQSNPARRIV
jgi:hypothetical protein